MKTEIAKTVPKEVASPLHPNDMPEMQPIEEGDTLRIPRLMLIQDKHKGIKEGWAKSGELYNSLTRESYGTGLELAAVYQRPMTRVRWIARDMGGGMACVSRNKSKPSGDPGDSFSNCTECPFYHDHNSKTGCTMNYEIVALIINGSDPRFWEPILLTAESTRPSDAGIRNILEISRYQLARGVRMFHKPFHISVTEGKNKMGEFYKTACAPGTFGGKLNNGLFPLDIVDYLEAQVKMYAAIKLDADVEGEEKEEVAIDPKTGAPKGW